MLRAAPVRVGPIQTSPVRKPLTTSGQPWNGGKRSDSPHTSRPPEADESSSRDRPESFHSAKPAPLLVPAGGRRGPARQQPLHDRLLLVHPEGFEPPALWFEARCSIQLSYECVGLMYSCCQPVARPGSQLGLARLLRQVGRISATTGWPRTPRANTVFSAVGSTAHAPTFFRRACWTFSSRCGAR